MKIIKGIEIDEVEELSYNIDKLRLEIREKRSFWFSYRKTISSYETKNHIQKASNLFKILMFIVLIPKYITSMFNGTKTNKLILQAENELIDHYEQPKTKVTRFRLKCERAKELYLNEIEEIDKEVKNQTANLKLASIGDQTKSEINALIKEFLVRRSIKNNKYEYYQKCGKRLVEIEEQIDVKQSIESSKLKLQQLEELQVESRKQQEVEKEFQLYTYYGDLLDSISTNLEKLESDKEEKMEIYEMMRDLKSYE